MKMNLYPKLAWHGISKNKKNYVPFLITSMGIVMMYYIVCFLSCSQSVHEMRGGENLQIILSMGKGVVALFMVIFLFYMNSFLMRRRKTEFGLYNILGMGKWNIARILIWENLMLFVVTLIGGLGFGILLSKLSELCAVRVLQGEAKLQFDIEPKAVTYTITLTVVAFVLILLYSLAQIHVAKPIELLRGEKVGEKPPKARWILALVGLILLGVAYYLSVTIKEPMAAIGTFFLAIVLVILATYLLFVCGSVALCKILQKNKHYYYKTNHFVSVSSMAYRMKRNGASLASICILSTMVLVMLSSSFCLFVGTEDSIHNRYPRDVEIETYSVDEKYTDAVENAISEVMHTYELTEENELYYQYLPVAGIQRENKVVLDEEKFQGFIDYDTVVQLMLYTLDDYNRLTNRTEALGENEVLVHMGKGDFPYDTLQIGNMPAMQIKAHTDNFINQGISVASAVSTLSVVVPDMETLQEIDAAQQQELGTYAMGMESYFGFDTDCDDETEIALVDTIGAKIRGLQEQDTAFPQVNTSSLAQNRGDFYAMYGGLLFLGILLSIVFLFAAVLIMYYKQISEGYEDASRFEIMQKVGMTQAEIRKSINSQVLTVFAAPLLAAGLHTGFAFPIVRRILLMLGLANTNLLILVTIGSFLIFAVWYVIVYRLTSRSYYQLVR